MYDPISTQGEVVHCLSQKGNINISIFVSGRVNIIRWIWPVPLRLLRDSLKSMLCLALSLLSDYSFLSHSNLLNLFQELNSVITFHFKHGEMC